jgi:hypothetical protein
MSERRDIQRIGVRLEVEVKTEKDSASMHTRDISTNGLFLECETTALPTVGTLLIIRIKQPLGDGEPPPEVKAEVVRIDKDGIALKFIDH